MAPIITAAAVTPSAIRAMLAAMVGELWFSRAFV